MSTTPVATAADINATSTPPAAIVPAPKAAFPRDLPPLAPALPAPGQRLALAPLAGSADALAIAEHRECAIGRASHGRGGVRRCAGGAAARRRNRVVRAGAARGRRFPTGRRCPTTISRRTRTWSPSGSRRSTGCRAANSTSSSSPPRTALYRLAPPSYLAARTFFLTQGDAASTSTRCARSWRSPATRT